MSFSHATLPSITKRITWRLRSPNHATNCLTASVDMDIGIDGKFSSNPWTTRTLEKIVGKWQTCMYEADGWNALFLENHDQSRSVSRFTPHRPQNRNAASKMLAVFIGLQTGTLFIYQGQELGMVNLPRTWSMKEYKDVETQTLYRLYVARQMECNLFADGPYSALEQYAEDRDALALFLDGVRSKARDHARSPVQVSSCREAPILALGFNSDYFM